VDASRNRTIFSKQHLLTRTQIFSNEIPMKNPLCIFAQGVLVHSVKIMVSNHKSQGMTVDNTLVLGSSSMDAHLTYVALSRHRNDTRFFTSKEQFHDQNFMLEKLTTENQKLSVSDFAERRGIETEGPDIQQQIGQAKNRRSWFSGIQTKFQQLKTYIREKRESARGVSGGVWQPRSFTDAMENHMRHGDHIERPMNSDLRGHYNCGERNYHPNRNRKMPRSFSAAIKEYQLQNAGQNEKNQRPEPDLKSEPARSFTDAIAEPDSEPQTEPQPQQEPEAEAEPDSEPQTEPQPQQEPEAEAEPDSEPRSFADAIEEHQTENEDNSEVENDQPTIETDQPEPEPEPEQ